MIVLNADLVGAILALIGALVIASQSILVRKSTINGSVKKLVGTVLLVNFLIWSTMSLIFYYPTFKVSTISIIAFILSGLFGFFLGYLFLFLSIQHIGASKTMPLIRTQVLVALILSVIFLGELLSFYHLLGIILLVIGTAIVSSEISKEKNFIIWGHNKKGLIDISLPLIGGVFWGLNWFFTKLGLLNGTPVILGLAISSIGGLTGFIILELITHKGLPSLKLKPPNTYWYVIIGFVCALAFLLNFSALSISRVVVVSPIWQVSPLFVLILSYILLPKLETITKKLIIGSSLIVIATVIVIIFM